MGLFQGVCDLLHNIASCLCPGISGVRDVPDCIVGLVFNLSLRGIVAKRVRMDLCGLCVVRPLISFVCALAISLRAQLLSCFARAFPGLCAACSLVVRRLFQRMLPSVLVGL